MRTLRAFAWMRWRMLMNSLERTGARDTIERLSLAVEQIGPLVAMGMLVPSALILAGVGGYAGYLLASTTGVIHPFGAVRVLMLIAVGFSLIGPLVLPSMERTSAVRLLLLPIPRRTLYVAQAAGGISEPWILLSIPLLAALPVGLAAGGAVAAAGLAFVAGTLLILTLVGVAAMATFVLQLIFRDRRRGELLALLFLVVVPWLAMMPGLLSAQQSREDRDAAQAVRAERQARGEEAFSERAWRRVQQARTIIPSELYTSATRHAAHREPAQAIIPLAGLAVAALLVHGLALFSFGRLLDAPGSTTSRSVTSGGGLRTLTVPGLSRGSAAVAQAQLRLALRTPRGRSILLAPVLLFGVAAFLMRRSGGEVDLGAIHLSSGLGLATVASGISLLSILPFAMNQFAVDRAGLTLALLAPLATRELLVGKAIGHALILGGPILAAELLAFALFPSGLPALWLSLPLGVTATYALAAPGAAALSAIFPRAVDLNSIGRGSNAHGAAGLLGLVVFVLSGLPSVLLAVLTVGVLERPELTPVVLAVWCAIALVLSRVLFVPVAAIFDRRRENLGMV